MLLLGSPGSPAPLLVFLFAGKEEVLRTDAEQLCMSGRRQRAVDGEF